MTEILTGDALETLKTLPDQSVNTCVTSPPYFGLRDYGVDGQFGLEPTPGEYVEKLVEVFREVKRVLRDDGTCWLNLGDSYAGSTMSGGNTGINQQGGPDGYKMGRQFDRVNAVADIPAKNLVGIPWRSAFALQADGWYLRQDIIWHKPNPMPESVRDRCTKAHEYLFLLSKSKKYFFDHEAIKEPATYAGKGRGGSTKRYEQNTAGMDNRQYETRNKRSVWSVCPKPFKGAHFAVFPPDLIKPCILAGCPEGGTVLDPFGGAMTTALVCQELNRNSISIELNPEYVSLGRERLGLSE